MGAINQLNKIVSLYENDNNDVVDERLAGGRAPRAASRRIRASAPRATDSTYSSTIPSQRT